jgi:hypothetical protein
MIQRILGYFRERETCHQRNLRIARANMHKAIKSYNSRALPHLRIKIPD